MHGAAPPWQLTVCHVCHRCLVHPPGSTLLLCPACRNLVNLSGLPPLSTAAQTSCVSCRTVMLHPLGTRVVVCPLCATHTPASLSFYVCPGCALYLVYSSTLPAVVCAVCHTLEPPIDRSPAGVPALMPLKPNDPPRPMPRLPPRRIPWLPSTPVRPVPGPRPAPIPRSLPDTAARSQRPVRPRSTPVEAMQPPMHDTSSTSQEQDVGQTNPVLVHRQSGLPPHRPHGRAPKDNDFPPMTNQEHST